MMNGILKALYTPFRIQHEATFKLLDRFLGLNRRQAVVVLWNTWIVFVATAFIGASFLHPLWGPAFVIGAVFLLLATTGCIGAISRAGATEFHERYMEHYGRMTVAMARLRNRLEWPYYEPFWPSDMAAEFPDSVRPFLDAALPLHR